MPITSERAMALGWIDTMSSMVKCFFFSDDDMVTGIGTGLLYIERHNLPVMSSLHDTAVCSIRQ